MKIIAYYCLIIISVVVALPLIIIKGCGGVEKDLLDGKKGDKIKVYFHKTKEVKEILFEDYIRGVVAAEMPASYSIEALKAQAVAARTYAYNKIKVSKTSESPHQGADTCTDSAHCQAWISKDEAFSKWDKSQRSIYWDKITWAVKSTAGELIFYNDQIANPLFHANSGGRTENAENVWEGKPIPYLIGVESQGEEKSSNFQSQKEFTIKQLIEKMSKEYRDFELDGNEIEKNVKVLNRTENDRVNSMIVGNKILKGTEVRKLLELKSTYFFIKISKDKIVFKVKGYGHGVGMSQCGANYLAQQGKTYRNILKHYYTGIEIKKF